MRIVRYSYPNHRSSVFPTGRFSRAPWSGLESEIDQLFATALTGFGVSNSSGSRFPVDVYEDKERTYVRAELPGVNRDDISVEVVDGYLTITAVRKTPAVNGEAEQSFSFSRSVSIPDEVQTDQVSAAYENGVLTVTLPKREATKPKKVTVTIK